MTSSGSGNDFDEDFQLPTSHIVNKLPTFKINLPFPKFRSLFTNLFSKSSSKPLNLDTADAVAVLFLTAIGMMSRVFRIQFPKQLVFDEIHFGNFTNWYLKGQYFHDIHPPLAKLIMAGVAAYSGYKGDINFQQVSQEGKEYPHMHYVALRITPAFFAALCVPLSYLIMRTSLSSHFASFTAALLVFSDLVLIIEGRHILSDGILHFFSTLAILSIFLYERYNNLPALIFEGIACGCVASCKYTSGGIVLLALIRQFSIRDVFGRNKQALISSIIRSFILCSCVVGVLFSCFAIHLTILPYYPENDTGMPACVRKGLVDPKKPNWEARYAAPSMVRRVISLVLYMHKGNMKVTSEHPYSSKWYQWPLFTGKWVLYWTQNGKHLLCMGNVLLWYPIFIGIVLNVVRAVLYQDFESSTTSFLFGWMLSYLPFALIPRVMFLYHYSIPVLFGSYSLVSMIETMLSPKLRGFFYCLVAFMAISGWLLWNPFVYGLTTPDFWFLVWNRKWTG